MKLWKTRVSVPTDEAADPADQIDQDQPDQPKKEEQSQDQQQDAEAADDRQTADLSTLVTEATAEEEGETGQFSSIARPSIVVTWPDGIAPAVCGHPEAGRPEFAAKLFAALPELADLVAEAVAEAGPGCLVPGGIRWSDDDGWQLMLTPAFDLAGQFRGRADADLDDDSGALGWRRDQRAVAVALVDAAVGRNPINAVDARRLTDLGAGYLPPGLDAIVDVLLAGTGPIGDASRLRALGTLLALPAAGPVLARYYHATAVGTRKAKGRPDGDNEDAWGAAVGPDGSSRLAIFDGTTNDGSGSGGIAARTALAGVQAAWRSDVDEPREVVDAAEQALADAGAKGCTTAILAKVTPDGRGRLASLGDSTAWLLRPHSDQPRPGQRLFASGTGAGWFAAWRLTPAHTVYAARLRADAAAAGGYSEITGFLGGAAGQPFLADFVVRPGDVLVLATDGATVERRGEWFGAALRDLAAARSPEHGPIGAGLASDLVRRAEDLGGWDNATALVVEFDPPPTDTAPARIAAPVKAAVPVKVAAPPEEVDRTQ